MSVVAGFPSHRVVAPNVYVEVLGVDFEDFAAGQVFEHRPGRTFAPGENLRHAARSLDQSARHLDVTYRARTDRSVPAIGETFVLGVVTALTTKTFGKVVANLGWKDVRFRHPAEEGDTVYAESRILETRASASRPTQGIVRVRTRAVNQRGDEVCTFERTLLVYRRGHGPYEEAGY